MTQLTCVLVAVEQSFVVDFVCKNDQAMLARQFDNGEQHVVTVECAGWVIRVDDHDALGRGRDLACNILYIGRPLGLLVAYVVHGRAAGK